MTAQTTTQRTAAHRRRMAEKMARMQGALERIAKDDIWLEVSDLRQIASEALNPTANAE